MATTSNHGRLTRAAAFLSAGCAIATLATAQTPISGNLSGTLTAGVYTMVGSVTVPSGQTLTLDPGVIIKSVGARQLVVNGTLLSNGTAANPVYFTDDADDSVGGDTNNNGPSVGTPGAWYNLDFRSDSDASVLSHTEVRFAGTGTYAAIQMSQADITLDHCTVRNCAGDAYALANNSFPSISNCSAIDNSGRAWDNVPLIALANMADNSASGNAMDCLWITTATLGGNLTLSNNQMVGGAFHLATTLTISNGAVLTCDPGTIVKWIGARQLVVNGTLLSNGTVSDPVIFTDDADDTAGGDTNKDGPSAGVTGSWYNLDFRSNSDNSSLTYTEVRYCGTGSYTGIQMSQADITADHCIVRDGAGDAFALANNSYPSLTNCSALDNGGKAWDNVPAIALPGMTDNVASGNAIDCVWITTSSLSSNLTLSNNQMVGGAFHWSTNLSINNGATLTCDPGTVVKFVGARQVVVNGTLLCNGTQAAPVVFTDDADDSVAGDTNKDGASVGATGSWYNLDFRANSDNSVLTHTHVRYSGTGNYNAIQMSQADITMDRCVVRDGAGDAFALANNSFPSITECEAYDQGGRAFDNVPIAAVPGLTHNVADGNLLDCIYIGTAVVTGQLRLGTESMVGGAFHIGTNLTIANGGELAVDQGCVVKWAGARQLIVNGTLDLNGTHYEPIVFTHDADDSIAGDTNKDGPSTGSPGAWYNIDIRSNAVTRFENVLVRYCGTGGYSGVTCVSPTAELRAVRVDHGAGAGFQFTAAMPSPSNLVAYQCANDGFRLFGGNFDLVHCTSAGNAGQGIEANASWTGVVANCNCYMNAGGSYLNLTSSNVLNSNGGFAGVGGNLDADPLFLDMANGDLHLSANSPCLGAGDYGYGLATIKDHEERSRILSHSVSGNFAPDMGAYEHSQWTLEVGGSSQIGDDVELTVQGPPGNSFYGFGILDGAAMIPGYGFCLAGLPGAGLTMVMATPVPVGDTITFPIPNNPLLVGVRLGAQALTLPANVPPVGGNTSEVYRMQLRP